jgi:hypothetical protein
MELYRITTRAIYHGNILNFHTTLYIYFYKETLKRPISESFYIITLRTT